MLDPSPPCEHTHFNVVATVQHTVIARRKLYRLLAQVQCAQCGQPFQFYPAIRESAPVSEDGLTLQWPLGLPSPAALPPKRRR